MALNTNWDTEKYRTKFEAEEHWILKRDFIEAHKERIPEERLICLAQVFVNIELLRCKYPDKVMQQVAILAKDVGHDYKAKQKKRLQRTFVTASDAASAKVKGLKRSYSELSQTSRNDISVATSNLPDNKYVTALKSEVKKDSSVNSHYTNLSPRMKSAQNKFTTINPNMMATAQSQTLWKEYNPDDPFMKILLIRYMYSYFSTYFPILNNSFQFSGLQLLEEYETNFNKEILCFLGTIEKKTNSVLELGSGKGNTQKEAKENAAQNALKYLLTKCYTIKVLKRCSGDSEISLLNTLKGQNKPDDPDKLGDDNIGAKMLKLMGWSGGALGKSGEGITEPINSNSVMGRQGLGLKNESTITPKFRQKVKQLLLDFSKKEGMADLVFAPDLSSDQRKHIHLTAKQLGRGVLKTTSYGKGEQRFLMVSHKLNSFQLMQKVLAEGGMTDKYKVCPPGNLTIEELSENLVS